MIIKRRFSNILHEKCVCNDRRRGKFPGLGVQGTTRVKQDWFSLAAQMWLGALEAQQVVALRTVKMMRGGAGAGPEMQQMVSEKIDAAMQAQQSGMELMLAGNGEQIA